MAMDEFFSSEVFLQALERYYDEWLQRIDDAFSSEEHAFPPAYRRKMEALIHGSGNLLCDYEQSVKTASHLAQAGTDML